MSLHVQATREQVVLNEKWPYGISVELEYADLGGEFTCVCVCVSTDADREERMVVSACSG